MNLKDVTLIEYHRAVKNQIREGKKSDAITLLRQALIHYPENPYILSYYGYLQAAVEKQYRSGVENCRRALILMEDRSVQGGKSIPTELFLNLGRAYIAAGRRKQALESLIKGLKYDRNDDLLNELHSIGVRRKPPVPFLDRSNPINKYIGLKLYARKNDGQNEGQANRPTLSPAR